LIRKVNPKNVRGLASGVSHIDHLESEGGLICVFV